MSRAMSRGPMSRAMSRAMSNVKECQGDGVADNFMKLKSGEERK